MRTLYLLSLAGFFWLNSASTLLAQPTSSPGNRGASSERAPNTVAGGTRSGEQGGSCVVPSETTEANLPELTALIPQSLVALTEQERVNLYVYIPPETDKLAVLEVLDTQSQTLFEQEFELSGSADAIARFVLPETVQFAVHDNAELSYRWTLSIYCTTDSEPIHVTGLINRLELKDELKQANDVVPPRLWHEELETWFTQRSTDSTAWENGLATEALEQYADRDVQTYIFVPANPLASQTSPSATSEP